MKFPVHSSWFLFSPAGGTRSRVSAAGKPSNRQTVKPSNFSMRTGPRSGSVLMETVLCLPLLLMLITGIWQFARIWEARLFTRYAAYNAARAALVYNVGDYGEGEGASFKFNAKSGPVWLAAVNTLAWMSHSSGAASRTLPGAEVLEYGNVRKGFYPYSARIRDQVWIVPDKCEEKDGYVKVTVRFDFPLIIPIYDGRALWGENSSNSPDLELVFDPKAEPDRYFPLTETCALPKPWSTVWYPRADGDLSKMIE